MNSGSGLLAAVLFSGLLGGCAANMQAAKEPRERPMHMSAADMQAMCNMHNQMMSGKTPEQRKAIMDEHLKSMSSEMRQHMQGMQQHCK